MSRLLEQPPFGQRDQEEFLREMNALCHWHLGHCREYRRMWPDFAEAVSVGELPFVHVGVFKHLTLKTEGPGLEYQRTLTSSATTAAKPSRIALDQQSSALQARSSVAILKELVGQEPRPLLILDSVRSLRQRGEVSARVAAAMSLKPLATEIHFLLEDPARPESVKWGLVAEVVARRPDVLVYGLSSVLWQAWAAGVSPARAALSGARVHFVHSGGWKKLESLRVEPRRFNEALLANAGPGSRVVDFYGLVEQVGIIYPLCEQGSRHVPRWADVVVRDPWTLEPLANRTGLLQLLNVLAHGAPYHSVLTEDLGQLEPDGCPCGWPGRRFRLLGRAPKAELRGCANV